MRLQAFSQPPDLRNLSCNDLVPQGNLRRESIHHHSLLAYQHSVQVGELDQENSFEWIAEE